MGMESEPAQPLGALVVEDSEADFELILHTLRRGGFAVTGIRVDDETSFIEALRSFPADVVLSDHGLPQFSGREIVEIVQREQPFLPVVIVTGSIDEETAADYIKAGAADYVVKQRLHRLVPAVHLLTAILGSTDLLLESLAADHPGREDALESRRAALRAADLTRQLLAFSRQQVLAPRVVDLNEVVYDVERLLRRLIGEDIELRTVLNPHLAAVRADPSQLEQVLVNLAVNARDAMPVGGTITIETANVVLDDAYVANQPVVLPGDYVMLAMSDGYRHGPGHPGTRLRAVLHHEGTREGHRPGPVHRIRHRQAIAWLHLGLQRAWRRHDIQSLLAPRGRPRRASECRPGAKPFARRFGNP